MESEDSSVIRVNAWFNDDTDKTLLNWMQNGTNQQQISAAWLSQEIGAVCSTGHLFGNCLANLGNTNVWHKQRKPCNLIYRAKTVSRLRLNISFDSAINGNEDWKVLANSILTRPNGP